MRRRWSRADQNSVTYCACWQAQQVHLKDREPVAYDVLSIDVGITPSGQGIPGALEHTTPVKPVSRFAHCPWTLP